MESSSQLKKELAEQAAAAKTLELDLHAQRDVRSRKFLKFLVKFLFFRAENFRLVFRSLYPLIDNDTDVIFRVDGNLISVMQI